MRFLPAACLSLAGGVVVALTMPSATAQHGAPAPLTEADSGRTITVRPNAVMTVRLTRQAGTGYAWRYTQRDGILPVDASIANAAPAGVVGGPEIQTYRFRLAGPRAQVSFVLARPWEKDQPPAKTVHYTFVAG